MLVHSVFRQELLGTGLVCPHGLEHSVAAWVLGVSGAPPMAERTPLLQPGPDCSNWEGQESPLKGAALLQVKQTPTQAWDVQGAVRAAAPSWKQQMKVNLDMHSLVYCFGNTFTLKCCCSREAIARSQEVACFMIRMAAAPKGRDGTGWADLDLPRTLAPGAPPRIWSTVERLPLMTWDLGAKRCCAVWGTALSGSSEEWSSPSDCDTSSQLALAGSCTGKISFLNAFTFFSQEITLLVSHCLSPCIPHVSKLQLNFHS